MLSPFKSATSKLQIAHITHKNTHLFKSIAENYGYKTEWTDSEEGSVKAREVTKLTNWHCQCCRWFREIAHTAVILLIV
jgi:hypothetical protein